MLVRNPAYEGVSEAWFDPAYWGADARAVSTGGRGSAWFIDADQGDMVLRHYRRGGLISRFSERSYVYTGWKRTRAFREFQLLKELYDQGLPVPEPVAAYAQRSGGLLYHAAILIRKIEGAVPLPEAPGVSNEALWRQVGEMIRRFHDAGLDHVDLNCDNILVAQGQLYLIDLDRCRHHDRRAGAGWRESNLQRLRRSVVKRVSQVTETQRERLWKSLLSGYHKCP